METQIVSPDLSNEFYTSERCYILESWNNDSDPAVSVARARVLSGVTTELHRLNGVDERYLIFKGTGIIKVGDLAPKDVKPGDVVAIPADAAQQITNTGEEDLLFYCICTPRFSAECYKSLE